MLGYMGPNYKDPQRRKFWLMRKRGFRCADCNRTGPMCIFDFDHRDAKTKGKYRVSTLLHSGTMKQVKDEADKCDLVCSNCHRIRTWLTRKPFKTCLRYVNWGAPSEVSSPVRHETLLYYSYYKRLYKLVSRSHATLKKNT